jgi:uncharacterized protein (TIGR02145 family)
MKNLITLSFAIIISLQIFAQAPHKMSYQAVIRNSSNNLVVSKSIGMQISILQGSSTGTAVYIESQTPTTNTNGLATVEIGTGITVSGNFSTINWANGPYFIKTETDINGGSTYTITGTSQLMSVPYALYANKSDSVKYGFDGDYNKLINKPTKVSQLVNDANYISNPNDSDSNPLNEIQSLNVSLLGDTLYISKSNYVIIPGISAANPKGKMTDIDGNIYNTIVINGTVWMAENLKTTRYANGDSIPNVTGNTQWLALTSGAWSYYLNNNSYNNTYGKLYNWYAISDSRNICPNGWHVPRFSEFDSMINYLGGTSVAGGKLKSTGTTNWVTPNTGANNISGFSGLPGGYRANIDGGGDFYKLGYDGWWAFIVAPNIEVIRNLSNSNTIINPTTSFGYYNHFNSLTGVSCRCVKN